MHVDDKTQNCLPEQIENNEDNNENELKQIIEQTYEMILQRKPDPLGHDNYFAALQTKKMTQIEIIQDLMNSEEFRQLKKGIRPKNIQLGQYDADAAEQIVHDCFEAVLSRSPDQDAKRFFAEKIVSGEFNIQKFISVLLNSDEYTGSSSNSLTKSKVDRELDSSRVGEFGHNVVLYRCLSLATRGELDDIVTTTQFRDILAKIIDKLYQNGQTFDNLIVDFIKVKSTRLIDMHRERFF